MTKQDQILDQPKYEIIRDYIKEINTNSVVSTSHYTLRELYQGYGKANVDKLLRKYFEEATNG